MRPSLRKRQDAELTSQIQVIQEKSKGRYGAPRIHAELARRDGRHGQKDCWLLAYCPCGDDVVLGLPDAAARAMDVPALVFRSGESDPFHTRKTSEDRQVAHLLGAAHAPAGQQGTASGVRPADQS